ncbi:MAG: hypothetical protein QHH24_04320 [Candidatus Bathyarchaeota archaeon]|nr:hypothetical protein [Candidatus Bathyarchaeota archaeon]
MSDRRYAFVMMIQNKYWQKFLQRSFDGLEVHSYVRRGFAGPSATLLLLFYVARPVGELAGYAEFIERSAGNVDEIWSKHSAESVLESKEQYNALVRGVKHVSFIRFKNLHMAKDPLPLKSLLMMLGKKRLSRAGFYICRENAEKLIALMD